MQICGFTENVSASGCCLRQPGDKEQWHGMGETRIQFTALLDSDWFGWRSVLIQAEKVLVLSHSRLDGMSLVPPAKLWFSSENGTATFLFS